MKYSILAVFALLLLSFLITASAETNEDFALSKESFCLNKSIETEAIENDVLADSYADMPLNSVPSNSPLQTPLMSPSAPLGAGLYDTSSYMLGKVAIGIIFPQCTGTGCTENWSDERQNQAANEIMLGLNWWSLRLQETGLNEQLSFEFEVNKSVPTSYEPIKLKGSSSGSYACNDGIATDVKDFYLWTHETLSYLGAEGDCRLQMYSYLDDLRNRHNADWALIIFVADSLNDTDGKFADGSYGFSYLGGPAFFMTYDNGSYAIDRMDKVSAHEVGHVFWALDEYSGGYGCNAYYNCSYSSGYLNVQNQNCNYTSCLLNVPSIMKGGNAFEDGNIDAYAKAQVGWKDSDYDGIPNVEDAAPKMSLYSDYSSAYNSDSLLFSGKAEVGVLENLNPRYNLYYYNKNNVSINSLSQLLYLVDSGNWSVFQNFSNKTPSFEFNLLLGPFAAGSHSVHFKAIDKYGMDSGNHTDYFLSKIKPSTKKRFNES